ncbi:MAG: hypothetical protein PQJ60_04015 [Spirochaetales bacterium]|nr:hypothetical protein [Spirochaetales bacterium]
MTEEIILFIKEKRKELSLTQEELAGLLEEPSRQKYGTLLLDRLSRLL